MTLDEAPPYPVHYGIVRPERFTPLQLLVRVVAFLAIGAVGLSLGTLFLLVYVALPIIAASRLLSRTDSRSYVAEDGPVIVRALSWIAAVSAWAGLVADRLPARSPDETVTIVIDQIPRPTPTSAIVRVVTGIPSAVVLTVLCWVGVLVWLWAAVSVLFTQQIGPVAFEYLVGLQRWSVRLLAYQASLVDDYPPFSFAETSAPLLAPPASVSSPAS
jgi:hypothetical protein